MQTDKTKRQQDPFPGEIHDITASAHMGIWRIEIVENEEPRMYVDDVMRELLGIAGQESTPEKVYTDWYSNIVPEAVPSVLHSVERMKMGHHDENTYLWKHPEKGTRYVRCGGTAKPIDGGYRLQGYHYDVDEITRKELEQRQELENTLNDRNAYYETIEALSNIFNSVHVIDLTDYSVMPFRAKKIVREVVNQSTGAVEMMKQIITMTISEEYRERALRFTDLTTIADRMRRRKIISDELLGKNLGWIQASFITMTRDDTGRPVKVIFATRVIDEEKRLEESLIHKDKMKSDFLAGMSHEIRTPINAILGMNTMILREAEQDDVKQYAQNIRAAGNTLLSLINDILDLSKIESGKMEVLHSRYRLDSVINDLINMIRPKAADKRLAFSAEIAPTVPVMLVGDEMRVKQIILNLLNNAVKYTKKGSVRFSIDVSAVKDKQVTLRVSVRDTGIGIKTEDMSRLFSPYERFEGARNKKIEGTGLGLSISENLLEKMNSHLEVESTYGEGSVFSFALTQSMWGDATIGNDFRAAADSQDSKETPEQFQAPDARILVADDIEMNLMVVKNLLKRVKITPELAHSGMEALHKCKEEKYDLVFLDAMMPEMSGEEAFEHIRADSLNTETPVVVLTANAIAGAKEEYLAKGFTDYLEKPINGIKLENMIQRYLPENLLEEPDDETLLEEAVSEETEDAVRCIAMISGINVKSGVNAAGGKETYLNVCENFCCTADERIAMLKTYYSEKDMKAFYIQVHGLKSSARLIGALALSENAAEMEMAAKDGKTEIIDRRITRALQQYEALAGVLQKLLPGKPADRAPDRPVLSSEAVNRQLSEMLEVLEAYDYGTAKAMFRELRSSRLPEEFFDTFNRLNRLFGEADTDGIIALLKERTG